MSCVCTRRCVVRFGLTLSSCSVDGYECSVSYHTYLHSWEISAKTKTELRADIEAALADCLTLHDDDDLLWTATIHHALSVLPGPWLLILNDACADVLKQLHGTISPTNIGRVVINTNERPDCIDASLQHSRIECSTMAPDQAIALLRTVSDCGNKDDKAYEEIAK